MMKNHKFIFLITIGSILSLTGCSQENQPEQQVAIYQNSIDINYGSDFCSFTNDVIETVRYGGKIEMENGALHKFMSVECTAGFYLHLDDTSAVKSIEIVDFAHGQKYLPSDQLVYLQSSLRPSPNGMFLTAIDQSNEKMKRYIYDAYPGTFYSWEEVLELVQKEWNTADNPRH